MLSRRQKRKVLIFSSALLVALIVFVGGMFFSGFAMDVSTRDIIFSSMTRTGEAGVSGEVYDDDYDSHDEADIELELILADEPIVLEIDEEATDEQTDEYFEEEQVDEIMPEIDDEQEEVDAHVGIVATSVQRVSTLPEFNAALANSSFDVIEITADLVLVGGPMSTVTAGREVTIRGENDDIRLIVNRESGIQVNAGGTVVFEDLVFDCDPCAGTSRRGIFIQGGHVTTRNVEMTGFTNSAIRADGGAAFGSVLVLEGGTHIHNNNLATGSGGGIAMNNSRVYMHDGVIIEHNTAPANGGGIVIGGDNANYVGHLEMSGGLIQHNHAMGTGAAGLGGGIQLVVGRTFNMTGGLIYDNTAGTAGGGIHLPGSGVLTASITGNSQIINNTAGTQGGGILSQRPIIIESTDENHPVIISENEAGTQGGGIRTNQSLTINGHVLVSENEAGIDGGGIWINQPLTITGDVLISENEAGRGGGGILTENTLLLTGRTSVERNHVLGTGGVLEYGGGGIRSVGGAVTLRDNARIYRNESSSHGGGIRTSGAAAVLRLYDDASIEGNITYNYGDVLRNGGGVFAGTPVHLNDNAQISNNIAGGTGGGVQSGSLVVLNDLSTISGNHATGHGGGLLLSGGTLEMNDYATIENNETNAQGGGVHAAGVVMMNSETNITSNIAGTTGGGIHVTGSGNLTMNHESAITENIAGTTGGGINNGGTTTITNEAQVSGNRLGHYGILEDEEDPYIEELSGEEEYVFIPSGTTGGGINNIATLHLRENAQIFNNTSNTTGGGIHTLTALIIGDNVQIFDNISGTNGGGISATQPLTLRDNVQIFDNRTIGVMNAEGVFTNGHGGGVNAVALTIYDEVTITDNRATMNGGGINATGTITLNPTGDGIIISGNNAGNNGGGLLTTQPFTLGSNVQITDNEADNNGGGVSIGNTFTMIEEARIESNRAGNQGGGVHATGIFTMRDDATIYNNHAGEPCDTDCEINRTGNGGGVFVAGAANRTYLLNNAQIINNHAHGVTGDVNLPSAGGNGGGALINGFLTMEDEARIAYNTSGHFGGGARVVAGLTMQDATVVAHNTSATSGGGLSVTGGTIADLESGTLITDQAEIRDNVATLSGGGLHGNLANVIRITEQAVIRNNDAGHICQGSCPLNRPGSGGGIANTGGSAITIIEGEALITQNRALGATGDANAGGGGGVGGGMLVANATLQGEARIEDNFAYEAGGGVRVFDGGTVNMQQNARIYDNEARVAGGGVSVSGAATSQGTFNMRDTTLIENNTATTGGGIAIALHGIANLYDESLLYDNTALTGGGVIVSNTQGLFTMNDESRLYNNHAIGANPQGVGGGLSTNGRAYINDRARIHYNTANLQGGGAQSGPAGTLIIQTTPDGLTPLDSSIDGNHQAGTFFGGIYQNRASSGAGVVSFGRAELRSGLIVQNVAQNNGGGVNIAGVNGLFYMPGGVITGNLTCGQNINNGYGGGVSVSGTFTMGAPMPLSGVMPAIYRYDEELDMEEPETPDAGCVVKPLEDIDLSGIDFASFEPLIIRNTAGNGGGGVSVNQSLDGPTALGGRGFMLGGRITENIALSTYGVAGGGGINLQGPRTYFTVTGNSLVDYNEAIRTAAGGNGGGIRSLNGNLTIAGNAQIEHNLAQGHGGGVSLGGQVPGTTSVMTGGHIYANIAQRYGGGIHIGGNSNFTMNGVSEGAAPHITDNFALRGGGISLEGTHIFDEYNQRFQATANIHHGIVADNDAQFEGGGIHAIGINLLNLHEGAQILRNSAPTGGGIRVAFQAVLTMTGGLISENVAQFSGGGISLPSSTVPLRGGPLNYARMYMTGGEISNNTADFGGGIGFTGVENWNMSHNSLNRLTITDTGTTVAYNTATHLVNGIELWGTHWRNPSNIGNQAIRPSVINESLLDYFEHAGPDWGDVGTPHAGYNRFALTNYDIQIRELTRTVRFTSVGPGFLRPGNIRHVVGLGAVLNEECDDSDEYCPAPRIVPEPVPLIGDEGYYCEFLYWVSDSPHHFLPGHPTTVIDGQVFSLLTDDDIRYSLPILDDTIFTAYFNCETAHIIVDFDIIGGTLHHPETGELPNYEFRLALLPDRSMRDDQVMPIPVADHPDRGCFVSHWTSDDESHPEIIEDDFISIPNITAEEQIRALIITRNTIFTAHVTCDIGLRVDFTVDYGAPNQAGVAVREGQLHIPGHGLLEYADFYLADLEVHPGLSITADDVIPLAGRRGTSYVFTTWTSSCPSHWIDGDPDTRFTSDELRELVIRRDTTFTAHFEPREEIPITGLSGTNEMFLLIIISNAISVGILIYSKKRRKKREVKRLAPQKV